MPAENGAHWRKDPLSWHAIPGCVPPDDEAYAKSLLMGILHEAVFVVWRFALLATEAAKGCRVSGNAWVSNLYGNICHKKLCSFMLKARSESLRPN